MSKIKTVALFVRVDDLGGSRVFVESVEVGKGFHWKTPSAFINEFSKIYATFKGETRFTITNIVIG